MTQCRKVRKGQQLIYDPVAIDRFDPQVQIAPGTLVRVCRPYGCPPPNTMGHCHIEDQGSREFLGLVCTNSLCTKEEWDERRTAEREDPQGNE